MEVLNLKVVESVIRRTVVETDVPGEFLELAHAAVLPGARFWRVQRSCRPWCVLHETFSACLLRGPDSVAVRWQCRGEQHAGVAGDTLLMEPGDVHRTTQENEPASLFMVWWDPAVLAEAAAELGLGGPVRFGVVRSRSRALAGSLELLCRELYDGGDTLSVETFFAEATRLALEAGAGLGETQRSAAHPSVRRAVEYLRESFRQRVSLDDLARETHLSKFHLARRFRDATGVAPHQYLTCLRLQAARRYLECGASVEESAALVGFADGSHLTRAFRKWLGVAPGSWARASKRVSTPPPSSSSPGLHAVDLRRTDRLPLGFASALEPAQR